MDDTLISLFIDDELALDEKIVFVEAVHGDDRFAAETLALLQQETLLQALPRTMPASRLAAFARKKRRLPLPLWPAWSQALGGALAMALVAGLALLLTTKDPQGPSLVDHRFVVYLPDVETASVVGTFTAWKAVPMEKIGDSGYWTLTLPLPQGEHRYSYLLGKGQRVVDPTIAAREEDDFGGENSLLIVGGANAPLS